MTPASCTVPVWIVVNSRIMLRLPITSLVGSSWYFMSCGRPPTDA
ncbi:hypothetical protein OKW37_003086 [Paraburkholderia sp. MM5482-R2]